MLTCQLCVLVRLLAVRAVVTVAPLFKQWPERSGIDRLGGDVARACRTSERITKEMIMAETERVNLPLAKRGVRAKRLPPNSLPLVSFRAGFFRVRLVCLKSSNSLQSFLQQ